MATGLGYVDPNWGAKLQAYQDKYFRTGVAAGNNNIVNVSKSLAVNETYTFPEIVGQMLEAGGSIAANVSAASSGAIRASGREVT